MSIRLPICVSYTCNDSTVCIEHVDRINSGRYGKRDACMDYSSVILQHRLKSLIRFKVY